MRELRVAAPARRVRCKLRRRAPQELALHHHRSAHGAVALLVERSDALVPIGRRLCTGRQEGPCAACVPRDHVDVLFERRIAELGEPEAVLLYEVDREPVAAGRNRAPEGELLAERLAGLDRARERRARAVPHDRVPSFVEPVIGNEQSLGVAARPPRRGAGVVDFDRRPLQGARLDRRAHERSPARDERAGRVHRGASVGLVTEPLLVRAARREQVERTPVWFMRQAGRSLPEYRAIRERHGFFEVAGTPELCAEVTLQPVRRHGVDAAVMFADIMSPVIGMGVALELVEGLGPVLERPIRSAEDVERLRVGEPAEWGAPILEAVRIVRSELPPDAAVIGFCGGPFTVAGYLVEGRPSRDFVHTKSLMYRDPALWHALLERLTEQFARYVQAKVRAGADIIQLFDSWIGALSPADYAEFVAPYSARILASVDVPTIHFGTGTTTGLLGLLADAGGDVIGLDWRIPLDEGWAAAGDRGVQGNLDPAVLLGPWERAEAATADVLARAGGRPGHIFNLGHGVLPGTDPAVLTRLAELVHARTAIEVHA
jgi:uroporphyrinogen decarboxylase